MKKGSIFADEVAVRERPSLEAEIIVRLNEGHRVDVFESKNGYYRIETITALEKVSGYVFCYLVVVE